MSDTLPEGHPLPWSELKPFEQEQGGYWLYPPDSDVYGNGRVWVRVPYPEQPGEMTGFLNRLSLLAEDVAKRAAETGNPEMASLGDALQRVGEQGGYA